MKVPKTASQIQEDRSCSCNKSRWVYYVVLTGFMKSGLHCLMQEWAKNTGRWKEGDPEPNYAQLKTRLRCAFNKAPDIDEIKALHCTKSEEPYKVYRFTERRGQYSVVTHLTYFPKVKGH